MRLILALAGLGRISESSRLQPAFSTAFSPMDLPNRVRPCARASIETERRAEHCHPTFTGASRAQGGPVFKSLFMAAALCVAAPAVAQVAPFPAGFKTQDITTNGITIHVRVGGHGPAVLLLHGYGETGDMWSPLASTLDDEHTVIVPDLRGLGLSSHPAGGFDKMTQGRDMQGVLAALGVQKFDLVTHDIGNMVGFALATQVPDRVGH